MYKCSAGVGRSIKQTALPRCQVDRNKINNLKRTEKSHEPNWIRRLAPPSPLPLGGVSIRPAKFAIQSSCNRLNETRIESNVTINYRHDRSIGPIANAQSMNRYVTYFIWGVSDESQFLSPLLFLPSPAAPPNCD